MNVHPLGWSLLALTSLTLGSGCATTARTARDLSVRHKAALVQVSGVLKIEGMPGQSGPAEQPLETIGTVLDAAGLTVVSATTINPVSLLQGMDMDPGGGGRSSIKASPGQIKIRRADGSEVSAQLILQDDDLDLAFVMPDPPKGMEQAPVFEFISLDDSVEARVMDELIGIGQLGKTFNWEVSAGLSRVMAKTVKPRTFYALAPGYTGGLGTPVFSAAGRPVGLVVLRNQPGARRPTSTPVIVPAADVMDLARQAVAAAAKRRDRAAAEGVKPGADAPAPAPANP